MSFLQIVKVAHFTVNHHNVDHKELSSMHFFERRRTCPGRDSSKNYLDYQVTFLRHFYKAKAACAPLSSALRASITIEAAMCVPVMIFMIYLILYPLRIMEAERQLQNQMEQTARYMIAADYAEELGTGLLKSESEYAELIDSIFTDTSEILGLSSVIYKAETTGYFKYFIADSETSCLSDSNNSDPAMIYIKFNYALDLPFSIFDLTNVEKSLVTNRRAWVGSEGGRGRASYSSDRNDNSSDNSTDQDTDRLVYIGKTSSSVYHLSLECHYLSNNILTADASQMSNLRNSSGGTYHACSTCKPGSSGTVYYFASGTAYHSSSDCSAITSYARSIPLSETTGMHVCSYCEKHYS